MLSQIFREIKKSARVAFIISAVLALFWFGHYLSTGSVPDSKWLVRIPRWWDILIGPLYIIFAGIVEVVESAESKNIQRPTDNGFLKQITILILVAGGLIAGVVLGLVVGAIIFCISIPFILSVVRKLNSEAQKSNDPIHRSPTQKEIDDGWEETKWKQY